MVTLIGLSGGGMMLFIIRPSRPAPDSPEPGRLAPGTG
ncbi:hypothetical protein SXCC_01150 [Gluconacetobacter sp. SXCC-1]|nr:hypothetical protein SXCC_01150 [Gluconacetobacter sp. SXCC-1]